MKILRILMLMILPAAMLVVGGCATFDWSTGKWTSGPKPGAASGNSPAKPGAAPVAGEVFLDAKTGAVFHALDTLAYPRQPVDLVAQLRSATGLTPIAGATVAFTRGDWVAGRITTDANGVATMRWTPPEAGNYSFEAGIVAVPNENFRDMLGVKASLLVAARDKALQVVVDLDHTVVDSSFFDVMVSGGKCMADSVEVLGRVSKRYGIIYLTHRPDLLTHKSKNWLADNGYPSGPLFVSEMKDLPDSGKFKSAKLAVLRRDSPGVAIGIGEADFWSKGYGTDAMGVMLRFGFTELNLHRISLTVFEQNPRGIRSYEKCGFKHEGRIRDFLLRDGKRSDMLHMGILHREWEELENTGSLGIAGVRK